MKNLIFGLFLISASISHGMEEAKNDANFEIITMPDGAFYKCLLCKYRPVSKKTTFLSHWVQKHAHIYDYTLEQWKTMYKQCIFCSTYHETDLGLKTHILRNHQGPEGFPIKKTIKKNENMRIMNLEKKAATILWEIARKKSN